MLEQEAVLVLNAVSGLGARRIRQLIDVFGGPLRVLEASHTQLMSSQCVTAMMAINLLHFPKEEFLKKEQEKIRLKGAHIITYEQAQYPESLRGILDAPVCLYVLGNASILSTVSIGIVGSRHAGVYGRKTARSFSSAFARAGVTVVSGLARGIDTCAHQGCLDEQGKTLAVTGCGLNIVYPKENSKIFEEICGQGAIISEYPMDTPPLKYNFPWRNRIISGLSKAIVVIEASQKSGALITATYGAEQNRDVFAVPANIDNPVAQGSNQLIQEGAHIALSPEDVLHWIGIGQIKSNQELTQSQNQVNLSPECVVAMEVLGFDMQHIDHLLIDTRLNVNQWRLALLDLELKGLIKQIQGQYYIKA